MKPNSNPPTVDPTTSHHVYIQDAESSWLPGRLIESKDNIARVEISRKVGKNYHREQVEVKLDDYPNRALPPQNLNRDGSQLVVPDMVDLPFLHEAAILYNLKVRHEMSQPYTSTGSILVAVNPYQWIKSLYTEECRREYSNQLVWDRSPSAIVAPHVYEVSSKAYKGLALDQHDQSILVSGESGAGKTETVKICLEHIASVQRGPNDTVSNCSPIVQRILESNPLLEAFGNAKTLRNDNSSRFGKYIQLQFDGEDPRLAETQNKKIPDCKLVGSKCEVYLLEKSRVVSHNEGERTYHIFYQLLAAKEAIKRNIWKGLANKTSESFRYVGWTETNMIEGVSDGERFEQTLKSLESVGIKNEMLNTLLRSICTVLQLGNIEFKSHKNDTERSEIASAKDIALLSELTGITNVNAFEKAFTERTIVARGEVMTVHLTPEKSKDACDAFAKEIYARAFLWLVRQINNATQADAGARDPSCRFGTIGLLDIFGFESFEVNSFEQLCINYANERLQQKFTLDVFTAVTAEYEFEGIQLDEIQYDDNENVLNLIEGRTGLLAMLNEECFRPNGNDSTFVRKAVLTNKQSPCLISEKMYGSEQFGIHHYAGSVIYDAHGFVNKNTDKIPEALKKIATYSSNDIIALHLENDAMIEGEIPQMPSPQKMKRKATSSIVGTTVWSKFRSQLNSLMGRLEETNSQYVRCIKPNGSKAPLQMESLPTVQQLRCAGVVAAVTISRSAFPNRIEHQSVLERFRTLWPKGISPSEDEGFEERRRENIDILLTHALKSKEVHDGKKVTKAFVIGQTRTYFRAGALEFLETKRLDGMHFWVAEIQKHARGYIQRRDYKKKLEAIVAIQAFFRMNLKRSVFAHVRQQAIVLQCWIRCSLAKRTVVKMRTYAYATKLQVRWRVYRDQGKFTVNRKAIVKIQSRARGLVYRLRYRKALEEKKLAESAALQLEKLRKDMEKAERKRKEEAEKERKEQEHREAEERLNRLAEERQKMEQELRELKMEKELQELRNQVSAQQQVTMAATHSPQGSSHERTVPAASPSSPSSNSSQELHTGAIQQQQIMTEEQKTLMEESGKIIEFLRKENLKLKKKCEQQRRDFATLKENNTRLMEANASAGASFQSLNQHARQLDGTNRKLLKTVAQYRNRVTQLHSDIKSRQQYYRDLKAAYKSETDARLVFEKAMLEIVDTVAAKECDQAIHDLVLKRAMECAEISQKLSGRKEGLDQAEVPADTKSEDSIEEAE